MIGFPKKIATKEDFYNVKKMVEDGQLNIKDFNNYIEELLESRFFNIPIFEKKDNYIIIPHNPNLVKEDILNYEALDIQDYLENENEIYTKIIFKNQYDSDKLILMNKNSELNSLGINLKEIKNSGGLNGEIFN